MNFPSPYAVELDPVGPEDEHIWKEVLFVAAEASMDMMQVTEQLLMTDETFSTIIYY